VSTTRKLVIAAAILVGLWLTLNVVVALWSYGDTEPGTGTGEIFRTPAPGPTPTVAKK
jgi:hypothetical protein